MIPSEIVGLVSRVLSVPDDPVLSANADALDAVICVMSALDYLSGSCIKPGADQELAEAEGWIWVKDPSLGNSAAQ